MNCEAVSHPALLLSSIFVACASHQKLCISGHPERSWSFRKPWIGNRFKIVVCRQEQVKTYCDIIVVAAVMCGHLFAPKRIDRIVYRSYFCAGSRAWLILPDAVRSSLATMVYWQKSGAKL